MSEFNDASPEFLDTEALSDHPQFASTLAHGLAVLGCFAGAGTTLGNKDIAERLGMTRPTVSRLTFTLMGLGYLRRDRSGKYSLGLAVLTLGYPLLSQMTIRQMASPEMMELAQYARGPVSIGTRDRLQVVYVETVQGREASSNKPDIGSTRPFLRSAIGRALLYALDPRERTMVLERLREAQPDDWAKYRVPMELAQRQIAEQGFCVVEGEWSPSYSGVGVPLRQPVHGMPMALNLTVPAYATDREHLEKNLGPRLVSLVRNIESKLGSEAA